MSISVTVSGDESTSVISSQLNTGSISVSGSESIQVTSAGVNSASVTVSTGDPVTITGNFSNFVTGSVVRPNEISSFLTSGQIDTNISTAVSNLVDSAPSTLDTLNELAEALNDDANFYTKVAITGSNVTFGNLTVTGDILPENNLTSDLGSPSKRFNDLYLSESSIFLGSSKISFSSGPTGGLSITGSGTTGRFLQDTETGLILSPLLDATGFLSAATGTLTGATGELSVATGFLSVATGTLTGATGELSVATGFLSVATGTLTGATGELSVATGLLTGATGALSAATGVLQGVTGSFAQTGSTQNATFNEIFLHGDLRFKDPTEGIIFTNNAGDERYGLKVGNSGTLGGSNNIMLTNREATGNLLFGTAGTVGGSAGETERMRITHDGKVGIGTTSPNEKLHVEDSSSSNGTALTIQNAFGESPKNIKFRYNDTVETARIEGYGRNNSGQLPYLAFHVNQTTSSSLSNSVAERMRITSSGNVGIGKTDPDKLLVVEGANAEIVINDTNSTPLLRLRENGITKSTISTINENLVFTAGGSTERMRIDLSGNVGIGTTDPAAKLHVSGDSLLLDNSSAGSNTSLELKTANSAIGLLNFADPEDNNIGSIFYRHSNNSMSFNTNNATAMKIDSNGNLGIGTDLPQAKLHVSGDTIVSGGNLQIGSTPAYSQTRSIKLHDNGVQFGGRVSLIGTNDDGFPGLEMVTDGNLSKRTLIRHEGEGSNDYGLSFFTTDGGSLSESIRFDGGGNVGIGTATPGRQLEIKRIGGSSAGMIRISDETTSAYWDFGHTNDSDGNDFQFWYNNGSSTNKRFHIGNDGNVGIGTIAPIANLQVGDASSAQTFLMLGPNANTTSSQILFGDNTAGDNPFEYGMGIRYDSSGNFLHIDDNFNDSGSANNAIMSIDRDEQRVGIGTTSPSQKLHIAGGKALVEQTSSAGSVIVNRTDGKSTALVAAGLESALLYDSAGFFSIQARSSSNVLAGNGDTNDEVIRIDSAGNIGIGASSPDAQLHVKSTGDAVLKLEADTDNTNENDNPLIQFVQDSGLISANIGFNGNSNVSFTNALDNAFYIENTSSADGYGDIQFANNNQAQFTITSGGNFGIGINAPQSKFHIIQSAAANTGGLRLTQSSSDDNTWSIWQNGAANLFFQHASTSSGTPSTKAYLSSNGELNVKGAINSSDDTPSLNLTDTDGTNLKTSITNENGVSIIEARNDTANGIIDFRQNNGTTVTTPIRIDASGTTNVGKITLTENSFVTETGSFTLGATHKGATVLLQNSASITITVPSQVSGYVTTFIAETQHTASFATGSGMSGLNSFGAASDMAGIYAQAQIIFKSAEYAFLGGNIS